MCGWRQGRWGNLSSERGLAHGTWGRGGIAPAPAPAHDLETIILATKESEKGGPLSDTHCLFCRIAQGEIPADLVRSDPEVLAFRDINPQAPTHILIIPRRHIASVSEMTEDDADLMGKLFLMAKDLAREEGISTGGYRMVVNAGPDAGQTVFHVHLHLLGGRGMDWPPG